MRLLLSNGQMHQFPACNYAQKKTPIDTDVCE